MSVLMKEKQEILKAIDDIRNMLLSNKTNIEERILTKLELVKTMVEFSRTLRNGVEL